MANTPPVPKRVPVASVIPIQKRPRRDETVSFETERKPESGSTEIIVGVLLDDERPTDLHKTIPEEHGAHNLMNLPVETFEAGKTIMDFERALDVVHVILEGAASVYEIDEHGDPMDQPSYELSRGNLINRELLGRDGEHMLDSPVRIVARTKVRTLLVTVADLIGPTVGAIERRARVRYMLEILVERIDKLEGERGTIRALERDFNSALDAEREKQDEQNRKFVELLSRFGQLERENAALNKVNRELTVGAVQKAVRLRLNELDRENRELKEHNRKLVKKNTELEATSKSQMQYVESVTEEVMEYERLRDLLGLESTDRDRLIEELRRIFLNLYQLKHPKLQSLGVLGLGELSELGVNLPGGDPSLSEDEIEAGIAAIPADPGSDPGPDT
ncbi:hypothetical protein M0Q28_03920 [Patescibacteria group bacterium]|jgi:hypothetical protein|nr:hypothetical protein [Patescibacteria group bacterium]